MHHLAMLPHRYENVNLKISTQKDTIDENVTIYVSFENNSTNDFYLLNDNDVTTSYVWLLDIYFQDTIRKDAKAFCVLWSYPIKKEYVFVKSGEKYTFHFNIDFSKIVQKYLRESNYFDFRKGSPNHSQDSYKIDCDYGVYSIKLSYADPYHNIFGCPIVRKAFKGKIESNTLRVVYSP
jgi:hypothetical protein